MTDHHDQDAGATASPTPSAQPGGWGQAPSAGPGNQYPYSTAQYSTGQPAPGPGPAGPGGWGSWSAQPAPVGPTGWYGAGTGGPARASRPRPPWFWPVIAAAVGLAALLAGGGAGFAVGHAIGVDRSHSSTTQVPGYGWNGAPGRSDGSTGRVPGQGTDRGSGSGSSDGSAPNS